MSISKELFGVDEPLLTLDDKLAPELLLKLESLWSPVLGRLRLDCVCNCMKESWLIVKAAIQVDSCDCACAWLEALPWDYVTS